MSKKIVGKKKGLVFPKEIYVRVSDDDNDMFLWIEDEIEDTNDGEIVAIYELRKVVKAKKTVDWEEI